MQRNTTPPPPPPPTCCWFLWIAFGNGKLKFLTNKVMSSRVLMELLWFSVICLLYVLWCIWSTLFTTDCETNVNVDWLRNFKRKQWENYRIYCKGYNTKNNCHLYTCSTAICTISLLTKFLSFEKTSFSALHNPLDISNRNLHESSSGIGPTISGWAMTGSDTAEDNISQSL